MTITYELTKKDYLSLQRYHFLKFPQILILLIPIILILGFLVDFKMEKLFAAAGASFMLIYLPFFRTGKMVEQTKGKLGHFETTISESGIKVKSEFTESSWDWSAIHRLSETKKYFYLFIHKTAAIIIPKSAFSSVQEQEEFRKQIESYIHTSKVA